MTAEASRPPLFDAHLHVVDPRFPLAGQGYRPPDFPVEAYRRRTAALRVVGGAVVAGSFQSFDQTYLLDALQRLGPGFAGVTQLPATVPDEEVLALDAAGVRAVRFTLVRGGSAGVENLAALSRRVHELAGWHTELYVDARDLPDLASALAGLPVCVDHLGLSRAGLPALLALVERGARVKATGFSRGDLDVPAALRQIARTDPGALVVGTDLPSTRAPRPFADSDLDLVLDTLGAELGAAAFLDNALALYRMAPPTWGPRLPGSRISSAGAPAGTSPPRPAPGAPRR
ncbi:MAG: amidohydrolase family protein [Actinomycetota bacterium]|nr:amidohydrolase family protein [Actinomycetota bacterium]